jgi:hypothetical protein
MEMRSQDDNVERLVELTSLRKIAVGGFRITDRGLACLSRLTRLQSVTVNSSHTMTGSGLAVLAQQPLPLVSLNLASCPSLVTLGGIAAFPGMTYLNLSRCRKLMSDAVKYATSSLRVLQYFNITGSSEIDDVAIMPLIASTTLQELHVSRTPVTYNILPTITSHLALRQLSACGCKWFLLSNGTIRDPDALSRVTMLDLGSSRLCDNGLMQLAGLPNLREIGLNECWDFTNQGLLQLTVLTQLSKLKLSRKVKPYYYRGHDRTEPDAEPLLQSTIDNMMANMPNFKIVSLDEVS